MPNAKAVTMLIVILVFSACGDSDKATPTGPSAPSAPSPTVPSPPPTSGQGAGTIAIRELSPAAGTMLTVESNCPGGDVRSPCINGWRGTFDVTVDREMTWPVLTVRFYDGQTICGYGASARKFLPAGTRVSFTAETIALSDTFGTFKQPCRMPAITNRIEVELWSDSSSWTNTLIQDFEGGYAFSEP